MQIDVGTHFCLQLEGKFTTLQDKSLEKLLEISRSATKKGY